MQDNTQSTHYETSQVEQSPQGHYFATHDPDAPSKLSTTLIHALADVMGSDVSETGFVLYDNIDPEALDRIFASKSDGESNRTGHLAFSVKQYRVTVYSDGEIVITPPHH
jgi:hypothetical protein